MRTIQPLPGPAWKEQQTERPKMRSSVIRALDDCLNWVVGITVFLLAGCASIPNVPTQNILMFSGDGKPIDPTGNINCTKTPPDKVMLCHEAEDNSERFITHGSVIWYRDLDLPDQPDRYYKSTYLPSLFNCMHEYFRTALAPKDQKRLECKQKPQLEHPKADPEKKKIMIFVHGGLNTQIETI